MTDYERGFVEGLQAACIVGAAMHTRAAIIGFFVSDLKTLGAQVHRQQIDPAIIAAAHEPFWWATSDGEGRS
jgi:hypothetical protein